jgi:hypothetical protein
MRLAALGGGPPVVAEPVTPVQTTPPPPPPSETSPVPGGAEGGGALPVYGNPAASSKVFNPDTAVIGNFLGATGKNEVNPLPSKKVTSRLRRFQAVCC